MRGTAGALSVLVAIFLALGALATPGRPANVAQAQTLGIPFVGANLNFTQGSESVIAGLAGSGGAKLGAATIEVHWDALETTAAANGDTAVWDRGNLATLDGRIDSIRSNNVTPVFIVGWAPPWAAPSNRAPLTDNQTFVRFMQALVNRYKDKVDYYFLWLEPDMSPNYKPGTTNQNEINRRAYGSDGAALAQVFNALYQASPSMKSIDPGAKMMLGPIAHDLFSNQDALVVNGEAKNTANNTTGFHYSFLQSFMSAVNPAAIDALGLNAYTGGFGQGWEAGDPGSNVEIAAKYKHVRDRLVTYNSALANLPIIFGEGGFWRAGDPPNDGVLLLDESGNGVQIWPCFPARAGDRCIVANEENQARYIPKFLARAKAVGVAAVFHYTFDEVDYDGTRGVVRANGTTTAGWTALRKGSEVFSSASGDPSAITRVVTVSGLIESYGFVSGGQSVVVIWARPECQRNPAGADPAACTNASSSNPTARVSAPIGSTAQDKLGDALSSAGSDATGQPLFDLSASPIYITLGGGTASTSTPEPATSPTSTPVPTAVPTVSATLLSPGELPSNIAPLDTSTGGVAYSVPTGPAGAVAVLSPGAGAPFESSLTFPAQDAGQQAIGVRYQPGTSLPPGASLPSGVAVAKTIAIDVFDLGTGTLRREHPEPIIITIRLSGAELSLCSTNPERIALLRVDSNNVVSRMPITLDCAAGTMTARISSTSSFGAAVLDSGLTFPFKQYIGVSPKLGSPS